jgi:hypothetical protein
VLRVFDDGDERGGEGDGVVGYVHVHESGSMGTDLQDVVVAARPEAAGGVLKKLGPGIGLDTVGRVPDSRFAA